MTSTLKGFLTVVITCIVAIGSALGQQQTPESKEAVYTRVINERAAKIVAGLGITDERASAHVQQTITQQYRSLNAIHESRKEALNTLKSITEKETAEAEKNKIEAESMDKLKKLHDAYLSKLAADLNPTQVEKVKDGMTYGVLPLTYKGYQSMLPDLTDTQKTQILAYLTEARELAMDAESSEKKHAVFGKYKGRINNFLSAAGIDMKKASKEWEERIAKEAENPKKQG
ncbi:DUF3826 domain-containing protein [Spirosoma aureum]|uniref:DUF3826 domain-containing protein n=1 Tax=Spirosoma aureum TaxID=2692134 RepID=A0A6G9AMA1_9BACT|nr:DUF3826 domain-containing protein [Spirosoma aureum]QIP13622.1 DUF3826 domain-containing protein [Spirosoma aureum]